MLKKIKTGICLIVALIVFFSTASSIVEHIKQETVERMKPPVLLSISGEEIPGNISTDSPMEQSYQTQFAPDQTSWPGGNGQEQVTGDYQAGYAAGYQAGYANGWWEGAQATMQLLLKYASSLQDMNVASSEFDRNGIIHPGGPTMQEGPKIKQAVDALTPQVGDLE